MYTTYDIVLAYIQSRFSICFMMAHRHYIICKKENRIINPQQQQWPIFAYRVLVSYIIYTCSLLELLNMYIHTYNLGGKRRHAKCNVCGSRPRIRYTLSNIYMEQFFSKFQVFFYKKKINTYFLPCLFLIVGINDTVIHHSGDRKETNLLLLQIMPKEYDWLGDRASSQKREMRSSWLPQMMIAKMWSIFGKGPTTSISRELHK